MWKNVLKCQWENDQWQLKNSITQIEDLLKFFPYLNKKDLQAVSHHYPFLITPYYLSLINLEDQEDALARQVLPDRAELGTGSSLCLDPHAEQMQSPVPGIIKRYPDRVILITSNQCAGLCRYCTRKWNWNQTFHLDDGKIKLIQSYLEKEKKIREVILTGGEPFLIPPQRLDYLLKMIFSIPHIQVVRIGTRILTFLPFRIKRYLKILAKYQPLYLMTHFNHAHEITSHTHKAIAALIKCGVVLMNQSVLLKTVNDQAGVMLQLLHQLQVLRVKPYYLFQCDLVRGTHHFHTTVKAGKKLMCQLHGHTSGLAIPQYVIDLPGGGKIPITPDYLISENEQSLMFKNYEGKLFKYYLTSNET